MDQYHTRQNRDLYSGSQGNGLGKGGPWTPRGRGSGLRGDAPPFSGSRGVSYFGQDEQQSGAGQYDQGDHESSLEKTLSGISLGKTFSGSVDGSDASGRLQRAQSRGLESGSYPQRGYQMGPMRGGSGELGACLPGRIGGRGEAFAPAQWQGRGRGMGPVRSNPTYLICAMHVRHSLPSASPGLMHAFFCEVVVYIPDNPYTA
jgi:hypothetical protein